jgi:hypothetical protein
MICIYSILLYTHMRQMLTNWHAYHIHSDTVHYVVYISTMSEPTENIATQTRASKRSRQPSSPSSSSSSSSCPSSPDIAQSDILELMNIWNTRLEQADFEYIEKYCKKKSEFVYYDKEINIDLSHICTIHSVFVHPICYLYWNSHESIYGYELHLYAHRVKDATTDEDYCYYEDVFHGMKPDEYQNFVKFMYIHISLLRYNHYNCKFYLFQEKKLQEEELMHRVFHFRDHNQITFKQDKCSICHEYTLSKSKRCKHYICVPCADKQLMLHEEENSDTRGHAICPVCRQPDAVSTLLLQSPM